MREAEPLHARRESPRGAPPKPPVRPVLAPSDYPESDGKPMAETPVHLRAMFDAGFPLHRFFKTRSDVYVGSNMFIYYREGDLRRSVVPDVWVAFGVPKLPERRTWLLWLEGKGPDFVLEITSKWTRGEDEGRKKRLYEQLGVRQYWQFDPTGDYLDPILKGRELAPDGKYRDLMPKEREGVLRHSSLLGLELCLEDGRLYYFDPVRKVRLLTDDEREDARQLAEDARRREEDARQRAEDARRGGRQAKRRGRQAKGRGRQAKRGGRQARGGKRRANDAGRTRPASRRPPGSRGTDCRTGAEVGGGCASQTVGSGLLTRPLRIVWGQ